MWYISEVIVSSIAGPWHAGGRDWKVTFRRFPRNVFCPRTLGSETAAADGISGRCGATIGCYLFGVRAGDMIALQVYCFVLIPESHA